jgi:hypothetical protein
MQAQITVIITAATTIVMMEEAIPVIPTTSLHLLTIIMTMVEELRVIMVAIISIAIISVPIVMEHLRQHRQVVVEHLRQHLQANYI